MRGGKVKDYWYIDGNNHDGYRVVTSGDKQVAAGDRTNLARLQELVRGHNWEVSRTNKQDAVPVPA